MILNPKKFAFGRHETFVLRYSWLSKGFQSLKSNPNIFSDDNATVELGVGKNMVASIKYWLEASQMAQRIKDTTKLESTNLGEKIFSEDGYDPYLEDEGTVWLIHWLLASNPNLSTTIFWFFNYFHKGEFTTEEVQNALIEFISDSISSKVSKSTIKNDVSMLLRMYGRATSNTSGIIEESLDSPFALFGLISKNNYNKAYKSVLSEKTNLPVGIFGYAVNEFMKALNEKQLPIESFIYPKEQSISINGIFRLSENALISLLENLVQEYPSNFELRETAGLHQLYILEKIDSYLILENHYLKERESKVA